MSSKPLMSYPSSAAPRRRLRAPSYRWFFVALTLAPLGYAAAQQQPAPGQDLPRLPENFGRPVEQPEAAVKLFLEGWAGFEYDDNVLRSPVNPKSDTAFIIAPRVRLKSLQESFRWEASAGLEAGKYQDISGDDYVDYDVDLSGAWTPSETSTLSGLARVRKDHQPIGDNADDPERNAKEATEFWRGDFGIDWNFKPNNWLFELGSQARVFDYDNARRNDDTLIFNDDRDRTEFDQLARVGYGFSTKLLPYVYGAYNVRSYRNNIEDIQPFDRDSHGFVTGAGVSYGDRKDDVFADLRVGYLHRSFSAPVFADVDDVAVSAEAAWRISPTFVLSGALDRSLSETTLDAASSYLLTSTRISATYDVLPNLSLYARARYDNYDFQIDEARTLQPDREDDVYETGLGAKWRLPHDLFLDAYYNYKTRDSSDPGVEYDSNAIRVGIGAQF